MDFALIGSKTLFSTNTFITKYKLEQTQAYSVFKLIIIRS